MSISKKLEGFLRENKIAYEVIDHPRAFTAQGTAKVEHVSGRKVAKVVMVKAGGRDIMAVVPANRMVSLSKLSAVLDTEDLSFDDEAELANLFPDCELGAMPAVGKPYDIPCYIDRSVLEGGEVCFNGGNHNQSVKLSAEDYQKIAGGEVGDFTT